MGFLLPGGLAPEWDGLGQVARQQAVTLQFAIARSEWNCVPPASFPRRKNRVCDTPGCAQRLAPGALRKPLRSAWQM